MAVLKAKVGGQWVEVGGVGTPGAPGPDEVVTGTIAPVDPLADLWVDTTDPAAPVLKMKDGTGAWIAPASGDPNAPKGILGYVKLASQLVSTNIGGTFDLPGMVLTYPVFANRWYKVTGYVNGQKTTAVGDVKGFVADKSAAAKTAISHNVPVTASFGMIVTEVFKASADGTKTHYLQYSQTTNGANYGTACYLMVEDLGADSTLLFAEDAAE